MSAVLPSHASLGWSTPESPTPRRQYRSKSRGVGIAAVVAVHVLIGWALASGLARKAVELVRKPIEMSIITEQVTPPPPPPPPPKVEKIRDIQKVVHQPPPAYVPPPEVVPIAPPPPTAIKAVESEPPKAPVEIAPPAPEPEPPKPAVVKQEISVACPGYQAVLGQALEEAVERVGLSGTVNTLIKIRGSQVVDVIPQSGPKEYYKYVQTAVRRMRCSAGGADEVQVALPVIFAKS